MLTNKYDGTGPEGELLDVTVKKTWVDEDGETISEKLPADLAIKLTGTDTNEYEHTLVPNADGEWTHTFKDLYKYDSTGKLITYSVSETKPNGYTQQLTTGNQTEGFVLTNKYDGTGPEGELLDVTVSKVWQDKDVNVVEDNTKLPASLAIKLTGDDGNEYDHTLVPDAEGKWKYTYENLYKYDSTGKLITYSVSETKPNGYTQQLTTGNQTEGFVLTNKYDGTGPEGELLDVTVKKTWVDEDGETISEKLPADLAIKLTGTDTNEYEHTLVPNADGEWTHTFKDLYKFDSTGTAIVYTPSETVPNGYTLTSTVEAPDYTFTLTNTYDGVTDNTDPENPEETPVDVTVKKVWLDEEDKPITGNLPAKLAIKVTGGEADLTADLTAAGTWTHTFKELKKFGTDGEAFVYEASETVPNGYTLTSTVENPDYTFTLTNTYDGITDNTDPENPEETPVDVTVKKVWLDEDDKPITENLPAKLAIKVTGGEADLTADLTAAGTWTHTFKELKKFGTDGEAFVYEASETVPNGYTLTSTVEAPDYTFTLTNTYDGITDNTDPENPEETPVDVTVKKVWLDEEDKPITGNLPAKLAIKVTGGEADLTADLTAAGTWTHTFKELKKFGTDGEAFVYEASETVPNGYTLTSTVEAPDYTFTLTNTYDGITDNTDPENPEETPVDITATKEWKGIPDGTKTFPKAEITLYQNGEAHGTPIELTATGNGKQEAKWEKLLKYAPGSSEYVYTVMETTVPNGYVMVQDGLVITNTYDGLGGEDPVVVSATKEWKGIPKGTKTFPKAVITLYQNGEAHGTPIELTATGNGKQEAKWEKLLKFAPDGTDFTYAVKETTVPKGYVMVQDGLVITNTYDGLGGEDPVVVNATKEWKGIPDGTKTFPKAVITLYQNDEAHGTPIELTATGNGKQEAKWEKLLKFAPDGTDFTYTVKETEVPKGYKMEQKGLDITNSFVPPYIPEDTITVLLGSGLNNNLGDCVD